MISNTNEKKQLCVQFVPLFKNFTLQEQTQVEKLLHRRRLTSGEVIIRPGDKNQLVIIAQGKVEFYQLNSAGQRHVLQVLNAGDYVGESWLFGSQNDSNYVEALTDSTVCILESGDFNHLLCNHTAMALKILHDQSATIANLRRQTQLLAVTPFRSRLVNYLLDLSRRQGSQVVALPAKLKDIASYLGTTPETLSRNLTKLQDEGIVSYHQQKITINQLAKIEGKD
ncbi:Crp/Fnr family transcriptional regulator [Limosilactobacillus viscerum]|uniref:Crp/Fnr family transcriptional regulator n=1 Tax=Limosilactobacillus viscerum TaxID=2993450 RepID=UPI0024BB0033|nr:Crp/Fnr family transcriptional regulator [Limosilactobacillus viscerum]